MHEGHRETTKTKEGLALSGGGFRAAFFHLGLLARMAELDKLRGIEVISTVSGGSIIGALYYLHIKKLLESKPDKEIKADDYLHIVHKLEKEFLQGVEKNLRMRMFVNPWKVLKMTRSKYSRSDRIAELYEKYFYSDVLDLPSPLQMCALKIQPVDAPPKCSPATVNPGRTAKIPILLLNATCLNTGHNWRFEAVRMGEPPHGSTQKKRNMSWALNRKDVDKNMRLRRPSDYNELPKRLGEIPLSVSVAASTAVPGVFHPLQITGLYNGPIEKPGKAGEKIYVQLVDGGVHDNQGLQGLVDRDCEPIIVSDASGQMGDEFDPGTRALEVLLRSNSIMMDRVREQQLFEAQGHPQVSNVPATIFHLRKGMDVLELPWNTEAGTLQNPVAMPNPDGKTRYGVSHWVQDMLSRMRTDLDSFTEVEAYSLMANAYVMAEKELLAIPDHAAQADESWKFLAVRDLLSKPTPLYKRHLRAAAHNAFKVFRVSVWAWVFMGLFFLAVWVSGLVPWFFRSVPSWLSSAGITVRGNQSEWSELTLELHVATLIAALLPLVIGWFVVPWLEKTFPNKWLKKLRVGIEFVVRGVGRGLLPQVLVVVAWVHLAVFDRLFLHAGRVRRFITEV